MVVWVYNELVDIPEEFIVVDSGLEASELEDSLMSAEDEFGTIDGVEE